MTSIPTAHGKVVSEAIVDSCIHLEGRGSRVSYHGNPFSGVNSRLYKVPPSVTGEPEFASVLAEALNRDILSKSLQIWCVVKRPSSSSMERRVLHQDRTKPLIVEIHMNDLYRRGLKKVFATPLNTGTTGTGGTCVTLVRG